MFVAVALGGCYPAPSERLSIAPVEVVRVAVALEVAPPPDGQTTPWQVNQRLQPIPNLSDQAIELSSGSTSFLHVSAFELDVAPGDEVTRTDLA